MTPGDAIIPAAIAALLLVVLAAAVMWCDRAAWRRAARTRIVVRPRSKPEDRL